MQQFTDNQGRVWVVAVDVAALKRVKRLVNIDLASQFEAQLLRLADDPILLCDILFAVCQPQAQTLGVSDEEFGRSLVGETLENAATALLEGMVDFFPPRKRQLYRRALAKLEEVRSAAVTKAEQTLASPELDELVRKILDSSAQEILHPSGKPFTNWPESSASIPNS